MKKSITLVAFWLTFFSGIGRAQVKPALEEKLQQIKEEHKTLVENMLSLYDDCKKKVRKDGPLPPGLVYRRDHKHKDIQRKDYSATTVLTKDCNQDGHPEKVMIRFVFFEFDPGTHISECIRCEFLIFHPKHGVVLDEQFKIGDGFCFVELLSEYPGEEIILWRAKGGLFNLESSQCYQFNVLVWQGKDYRYLYQSETNNAYITTNSASFLLDEFPEYWKRLENLKRKDAEEILATPKEAIRHYFLLNQGRLGLEPLEPHINPWGDVRFKEIYKREKLCVIWIPWGQYGDTYLCKKGSLGWRVAGIVRGEEFTSRKAKEWGLVLSEEEIDRKIYH